MDPKEVEPKPIHGLRPLRLGTKETSSLSKVTIPAAHHSDRKLSSIDIPAQDFYQARAALWSENHHTIAISSLSSFKEFVHLLKQMFAHCYVFTVTVMSLQ